MKKQSHVKKLIFLLLSFSMTFQVFGKDNIQNEIKEMQEQTKKILKENSTISTEAHNKMTKDGIFSKCEKTDYFELGMCYGKCDKGWKGVLNRCYKNCDEGYTDTGIACVLPPDLKKRPKYNRGAGTAQVCPSGKDKKAGRCLDRCKNGYAADKYGNRCRQSCGRGYRTYRYVCYKNWRSWNWRKSYSRGLGKLPSICPQGKEKEVALCYPKCKNGFTGRGPLCLGSCPNGYKNLEVTCKSPGDIKKKVSKERRAGLPVYVGIKKPKNIKYIKDEFGRSLILHGVNSSNSSKSNKEFMPWVTENDVIQETKQFGFNGIRFLIFWAAVEPKKGEYDYKYLERVAERVKWYTDNGAYVVLDMHQDVYGYAVGGNGAPAWATDVGPYEEYLKEDVTDIIYEKTEWEPVKHMWWLENINPATMEAYKRFWDYDNHPWLQDHYVNAWKEVAKKFKDNPKVIGYDLMNEPHHPNLTPYFEHRYLGGFYKRLIKGIRELDNDKYIFFEPRSFSVNFGLPSGLKKVEDIRRGESRIVYSPHLYPVFIHEDVPYGSADKRQVSMWSRNRSREANLHEAPLWAGEVGANENAGDFNNYVEEALNLFDYMGAGWAWYSNQPSKTWALVDWDRKENKKLFFLVRAYPRAVAGHPEGYSFDVYKAEFFLKFKTKENVKAKTEIFVPKRHYPNGYTIKVYNTHKDASWSHTYDDESQILYLETKHVSEPYAVVIERK